MSDMSSDILDYRNFPVNVTSICIYMFIFLHNSYIGWECMDQNTCGF